MGFLHVYTGNGKGKTTAAFGLALRAAGRGKRVFIGQFLKHEDSGEVLACAAVPGIETALFGVPRRVGDPMRSDDRAAAARGLEQARSAVESGRYDLVVLDELNVAVARGVVDPSAALELIRSRSVRCELVFTGRDAHPEIIEAADLVTEFRDLGHYARTGVPAREGIEF